VADFREEVLFGEPEIREAGVLGGRGVFEVLPVDRSLGVLGPGLRDLELGHQSEFHPATSHRPERRTKVAERAWCCVRLPDRAWLHRRRERTAGPGYSTAGRMPDATTALLLREESRAGHHRSLLLSAPRRDEPPRAGREHRRSHPDGAGGACPARTALPDTGHRED